MKKIIQSICIVALLVACLNASAQTRPYGWSSSGSQQARTVTDAKTVYPIVLVHGLTGTDKFANVVAYWYGIAENLRAHGAKVYVANVSAFNSDEERGEQLKTYVEMVLIENNIDKVNLIAHSQGGTTSRYLAYTQPQMVASITTISTPHHGTEFADFVDGISKLDPTGIVRAAVSTMVNAFWPLITSNPSLPQDSLKALTLLSTKGAAEWNTKFPSKGLGSKSDCTTGAESADIVRTSNGVQKTYTQRYYSLIGNNIRPFLGIGVDASLKLFDPAIFDATTVAMLTTGNIIMIMGGGANDGLVPECSAKFGKIMNTQPWNHLDEVNQLLRVVGGAAPDPVTAIRQQVQILKAANL
ncbi:esterase/lipase family protein [Luteimonas panaciterrae]|uniref:esterase/lipase family protein n=1 Tax=Luteimonas panaciterrae TaxID=363885 RepID=UPI001CFBB497|nr:triacylglycerol lipase [Luteimonas panaciterrae]